MGMGKMNVQRTEDEEEENANKNVCMRNVQRIKFNIPPTRCLLLGATVTELTKTK